MYLYFKCLLIKNESSYRYCRPRPPHLLDAGFMCVFNPDHGAARQIMLDFKRVPGRSLLSELDEFNRHPVAFTDRQILFAVLLLES